MSGDLVDGFERDGFVVLREVFDSSALVEEFDTVRRDAFGDGQVAQTLAQGSGTVTFLYVPMMCERTPVSVALIDRCAVHAAELVGRPVLPGRAKGTWYEGDTGWHRDSTDDLVSVGVLAYIEPLAATTGAFRVLPGSHVHADEPLPERGATVGAVVETEPGDVIIFDEHLVHGSVGGLLRRQWRVDFVVDPRNKRELAAVDAWFAQSIPDERLETAYDSERYPSYGPHWQALERPWTRRLRELGVYDRANGRAS